MHLRCWLAASILAVSSTSLANAQALDRNIFTEPFISSAHAQAIQWQKVDEIFGRKPAVAGEVHRYGFPRSDVTVTLDSVTIKPTLAWTADEESCPHVVGAGRPPFRRSRSRGATVVQGMRGATQGVHEELRRACLQNRVPDVSKVMQVEAIATGASRPRRRALGKPPDCWLC